MSSGKHFEFRKIIFWFLFGYTISLKAHESFSLRMARDKLEVIKGIFRPSPYILLYFTYLDI